ncbi:hypothetical protein SO802_011888 [Lithocarpus litseifolius]|uniref:Uncharacterized protein n=1 Tax=Lithocarpus litseifolius TaxID=425828 RepID=A0AAW2D186_9ROSI
MMKGCVQFLGMGHNRETRRKKYLEGASKDTEFRRISGEVSISLDISLQSKNIFVRIVHVAGQEERYQVAVPASQLMEKYPGMFVARTEVFKKQKSTQVPLTPKRESLAWSEIL